MENVFDRAKHVYQNDAFSEMLKDAMRFFHGTPVFPIPPPEAFDGAGVYALYYIGREGLYRKFGEVINRTSFHVPIYVGKAVSRGWRQSRLTDGLPCGRAMYERLRQHVKSIHESQNLKVEDFTCRFMIFEGASQNMLTAVEAALIAEKMPLWNSVIDGFGNHDPGGKRVTGRLSAWDALHLGRTWAARISGEKPDVKDLKSRITDYLVGLR